MTIYKLALLEQVAGIVATTTSNETKKIVENPKQWTMLKCRWQIELLLKAGAVLQETLLSMESIENFVNMQDKTKFGRAIQP